MGSDAWTACRRTWRYICEPQGFALGFLLALLGFPFAWWLEGREQMGLTRILVAAAPLGLWLLLVFVGQYILVARDAVVKHLRLLGDQPVIQARQNGWEMALSQTDSGITLAVRLEDPTAPWPPSGRWEVRDPYRDEYRVIIRTWVPPVPGAKNFPPFAQVTWPGDFGAGYANGEHSAAWVVNGETMAQQTFTTRVLRGKAPG